MRQTMPGNRGVDDGLHVVENQLDLDYDLQIGAFLFIFLGKNCAADSAQIYSVAITPQSFSEGTDLSTRVS